MHFSECASLAGSCSRLNLVLILKLNDMCILTLMPFHIRPRHEHLHPTTNAHRHQRRGHQPTWPTKPKPATDINKHPNMNTNRRPPAANGRWLSVADGCQGASGPTGDVRMLAETSQCYVICAVRAWRCGGFRYVSLSACPTSHLRPHGRLCAQNRRSDVHMTVRF